MNELHPIDYQRHELVLKRLVEIQERFPLIVAATSAFFPALNGRQSLWRWYNERKATMTDAEHSAFFAQLQEYDYFYNQYVGPLLPSYERVEKTRGVAPDAADNEAHRRYGQQAEG